MVTPFPATLAIAAVIIFVIVFLVVMKLFSRIVNSKTLLFTGYEVEKIGTIKESDRPEDEIEVFKLRREGSEEVSWCLNIITRSRRFHGGGRLGKVIPIIWSETQISDILNLIESKGH